MHLECLHLASLGTIQSSALLFDLTLKRRDLDLSVDVIDKALLLFFVLFLDLEFLMQHATFHSLLFVEDSIFELVFVNFGQVLRLLVSCSLGGFFLDRCQITGLNAYSGMVFFSASCHDGILLIYVLYLLLVILVHHVLVLLALFLCLLPFVDIHACKLDLALYLLVLGLEVVYTAFDLLLLIGLDPKLLPCLPHRRHICE